MVASVSKAEQGTLGCWGKVDFFSADEQECKRRRGERKATVIRIGIGIGDEIGDLNLGAQLFSCAKEAAEGLQMGKCRWM